MQMVDTVAHTASASELKSSSVQVGEQSGFNWYVVHVAAGSENRIAEELKAQMSKAGLAEMLEEVLVPKKQDVTLKRGAKVLVEDRILPGYVLVRMRCLPETLHVIRRVPRVIGMLGTNSSGIPRSLNENEVKLLLDQLTRLKESVKDSITFEAGEVVKICEGLFSSMEGVVEEVDMQRLRLKVSISILGRSTPVELEFFQVEKST